MPEHSLTRGRGAAQRSLQNESRAHAYTIMLPPTSQSLRQCWHDVAKSVAVAFAPKIRVPIGCCSQPCLREAKGKKSVSVGCFTGRGVLPPDGDQQQSSPQTCLARHATHAGTVITTCIWHAFCKTYRHGAPVDNQPSSCILPLGSCSARQLFVTCMLLHLTAPPKRRQALGLRIRSWLPSSLRPSMSYHGRTDICAGTMVMDRRTIALLPSSYYRGPQAGFSPRASWTPATTDRADHRLESDLLGSRRRQDAMPCTNRLGGRRFQRPHASTPPQPPCFFLPSHRHNPTILPNRASAALHTHQRPPRPCCKKLTRKGCGPAPNGPGAQPGRPVCW